MPLSKDVKLPKTHTPAFPNRCIACGAASPGATHEVRARSVEWLRVLLGSSGKHFSVQIPACMPCADKLSSQQRLDVAINWIFIGIGMALALWLLQTYQGPLKQWLVTGIAMGCFLPVVAWRIIFPREFDVTVFADSVMYEFRDADYAQSFALRNFAAVRDAAR